MLLVHCPSQVGYQNLQELTPLRYQLFPMLHGYQHSSQVQLWAICPILQVHVLLPLMEKVFEFIKLLLMHVPFWLKFLHLKDVAACRYGLLLRTCAVHFLKSERVSYDVL